MRIHITGARVLGAHGWHDEPLHIADGRIVDGGGVTDLTLAGEGLVALPGIVDLHGDAFERQIMPRPGVHFPVEAALLETDQQMVANGITTAYHGLTYSWEPGLRGAEAARTFIAALEAVRPRLRVDTRLHLRHETFNVAAEEEILGWIGGGRIDLLAFNDHIAHIDAHMDNPAKVSVYAGRSGLTPTAFAALHAEVKGRAPGVRSSIERLAAAARTAGVPMASHDDETVEDRAWYDRIGCTICEFPIDAATAAFAAGNGDPVIMGAPNVLRGGSHCGRMGAAEAVRDGLCSVLTSDYHHPSLAQAAFRLAADGVVPLQQAWPLVSSNPATAVGLDDRGVLAVGKRADVLLVDATDPRAPQVRVAIVGGRLVHVAGDAGRLLYR